MAKVPEWSDLLNQLSNPHDAKVSIRAAKVISKVAEARHVKDLYTLLQSGNFFLRESAALPLARLEGIKALPHLFRALQQGELDGHDNDGLTHTLIGLIESNKRKVTPLLLDMLKNTEQGTRADAIWALGFVTSQVEPSVFINIIKNDTDPEVRSMAADALQSYRGAKKKYPVETENFHGRWMWLEPAENLQYGFDIEGSQGICVKSNSPGYAVGDVILKIEFATDPVFLATQIFTNWTWYTITGIRDGNTLHLQGAGLHWTMVRME